MSLFRVISGVNTGYTKDLNYYVFEKGVSISKIKKRLKLESTYPNLPDEIKSCYENSNTYLGVADIYAREFTINDDKTLFLNFCDLTITDPFELNDFLSEHGFLSNINHLSKIPVQNCKAINPYLTKKQKKQSDDIIELYGEPLSLWILTQLRLRTLIRTWRFLKASEKKFENSYFHLLFGWDKDRDQWYFNDDQNNNYEDVILSHRIDDTIIEESFLNELKFNIAPHIFFQKEYKSTEGGIGALSSTIPQEIRKNSQVLNFANNLIENEINSFFSDIAFTPELKFNSRLYKSGLLSSGKSGFATHYNSLLQTMFYQFVYAVTNDMEFTRCLECQKWIEKLDQGKKGKLYCDHKCRTKAYRRRRDLRLIFTFNEPKGKFDIIKNLQEWCEAVKSGEKELEAYHEELSKKTLNKEVKKIILNTITNTFDNVVCWATNKSVAEHLDIDEKYIDLDSTREFVLEYYSFYSKMSHFDWDPNHNWS